MYDLSLHPNFPRAPQEENIEPEGACPVADAKALLRLIVEVAREGMVAVEIGSWFGLSTKTIARVVGACNGVVYCVDHWLGSSAEPGELQRVLEVDVFQGFKANMIRLGLWRYVRPMVMPSLDAARIFRDAAADFVFIDANHSFEEVRRNIQAWLPKVTPGGILCGHDYDGSHPGVMDAVNEAFPVEKHGLTIWAKHL